MSQLDQEHDVVALASELGLSGDPAEAVVQFCESKIDHWAKTSDYADLEMESELSLSLMVETLCRRLVIGWKDR